MLDVGDGLQSYILEVWRPVVASGDREAHGTKRAKRRISSAVEDRRWDVKTIRSDDIVAEEWNKTPSLPSA